jgi:RimJ/RimL family protein N-acetyltransferase
MTLLVKVAVRENFSALRAMKSDPEAIKWSGFSAAPDPKNRTWFDEMLSDPNQRVFIGFIGQEPVAYAQFRWEDGTDRFGISYGVAKDYRRRGLGAEVLKKAMEQMTATTGAQGRGYEAWIAKDNTASQKAAKNAGFSQRPEEREDTFLSPIECKKTMQLWVKECGRSEK